MFIKKANQSETNQIIQKTPEIVEESSVGYVKKSNLKATNMFLQILNNGASYLVAIEEKSIIGWILTGSEINPYQHERVGFIFDLYVHPDYRKRGIAKKLIHFAMADLKRSGHHKVQLNVFNGNPAEKLYEELGFSYVSSLMEKDI